MIETLRFVICALLMALGLFFEISAVIGVFRFRYVINRMHAAALGALMFFCLLRSVLGPRVADRVVGINMIGTIVIEMVAILALMLNEGYLMDVAIIYAMLSFLATVVLVKIVIGVHRARKAEEEKHG